MKYLFLICFLLPLCAFSQKGYLHLYGGYSPKDHDGAALFGFSAGGKLNRSLALGAGISSTIFDKPYFPLTLDLTVLEPQKKVSPIAGVKVGYGIYNNDKERGGFTGSLFGGISVPVANFKTNLMIGVTHYSFTSTLPGIKLKKNQDRLTFTLGFLL
jgi:hypothetical protein